MNAGYPRNRSHAAAFRQHGNDRHFLFGFKDVCHIVFYVDIIVKRKLQFGQHIC